jgi:RNA polymerase sigma-70 factor (ECF subfamily)
LLAGGIERYGEQYRLGGVLLLPEDMSLVELIKACAKIGSESVWEEFQRRFHRVIGGAANRTARVWGDSSPAVLDDLIQETYLKLCSDRDRLLEAVRPDAPEEFYGYIKSVATNVAHDYFRRTISLKRDIKQEVPLDVPGAHEVASVTSGPDQMEKAVLIAQIDSVLLDSTAGENKERNRNIFWFYYRLGMTALEIARLPDISLSEKGVETQLLRLTRLIKRRLAASRI